MRVISLNVNGIRAAARKGFFDWMVKQKADVVCLQEIKAQEQQLTDAIFYPKNYHAYFFAAEKKGYSGVAIYSKHQPKRVQRGLGWETADTEGRYLQLDFEKLSIASLYLPSGTSGEIRQAVKMDFLDHYAHHLRASRRKRRDYIICGDWNIAHQAIDLKNWRANQKNSGFLPEERAWLDTLFDDIGYLDAFRILNPHAEHYTWWSNRGRAWDNNVGWRIDYQMITPKLQQYLKSTSIYKEQRFSDHAPLIIDYNEDLI